MLKNVASKLVVFCWDVTTGLPKVGDSANLTAYRSLDFGAVTVLADTSATEMDSTNAKGYYLFDLAQGETNGDVILYSCKSATANIACVAVPAVVYTIPATGLLAPTVAGRTLDVSSGGEAGLDWANVGSPTTSLALTGTTIATTQKVDVETIKTQAVTAAVGVTFLASVGTAATSTAQTGDAFARIGATGSGLTSLAASATALSTAQWSNTRAGYLDNLSAGAVVLAGSAPSWYAAPVDVSANVTAIKAKTDNLPATPAAVGSAMTLADGAITDAKFTLPNPTAPATGAVGMMQQLWRRFFKKATLNKTTGDAITYADNGTTIVTTQVCTDDGTVQTQGPAT